MGTVSFWLHWYSLKISWCIENNIIITKPVIDLIDPMNWESVKIEPKPIKKTGQKTDQPKTQKIQIIKKNVYV